MIELGSEVKIIESYQVYVNNEVYESDEFFEIEIFEKLKPKKESYTIQDFTQSQAHGFGIMRYEKRCLDCLSVKMT